MKEKENELKSERLPNLRNSAPKANLFVLKNAFTVTPDER
jgi:hypothetical protein